MTQPKSSQPSHYVTRIVVERVDFVVTESRSGIGGARVEEVKRVVTELTSLTLKSDALVSLVEKTGKHLDLVEDIIGSDPVRVKGTRSSEA